MKSSIHHCAALQVRRITLGTLVAALLAGCAGMREPEPTTTTDTQPCQAAAQGDAWIGNWLGVDKRQGVTGELQVQMILQQDGTMTYTERLKRPGKSPQSINETGCWQRDGQVLVMQTTHSNAVAVEPNDPIYTNQYQVVSTQGGNLALKGPEGPLTLKRMPNDYRLPLF